MRNVFVFLTLFLVLLTSCEDKKENGTFNGKPVLTKEEAVKALNTLAFDLASDRNWTTLNNLEILQKTPIKANELPVKSATPMSFYLKDSGDELTEYNVVIELNGPHNLEKLKKSSGNDVYRVALDPDQFYLPEDPSEEDWTSRPTLQLPTYYYAGDETNPVEETITFGSGITQAEPIFFVTLIETSDGTAHKSAVIPGAYLAFFGLDLRYDTDDGNEEFELFLSNGPNVLTNPFNPSTIHMFNGSASDDASGLTRNYPDINYIANGWNVDTAQSIALRVFDGATFRLTPIEDDYSAGNYCRNGLNVGQTSDHNV
ncbi:hypothetical protein JNL27_05745, partial [bacterium]|nr:hypothetical protein [bacterium]